MLAKTLEVKSDGLKYIYSVKIEAMLMILWPFTTFWVARGKTLHKPLHSHQKKFVDLEGKISPHLRYGKLKVP